MRLSTKLDLVCIPTAGPAGPEDPEPSAAYAHAVLRTLADALATKVQRGDADVQKYVDALLPRLFNLHVYAALASDGDSLVPADPRLVAVSAEVVALVLQTATVQ